MRIDDRIRIGLLVGGVALAAAIPVASALGNGDTADGTSLAAAHHDDGGARIVASETRSTAELEPLEASPSLGDLDMGVLIDRYEEFADGLADHLAAAGIDHEVRTVPFVSWDLTDDAANAAVMEYLEQSGLPIFGGLSGDWEEWLPDGFPFELPGEGDWGEAWLPEDLLGEMNATADELAAFLDERDIGYEVEEGPLGVRWVIPDLSDPDARAALQEFAEEHGGLVFGGGGLPGDWEEWLPGPDHRFDVRPGERLGEFLRDVFGVRRRV